MTLALETTTGLTVRLRLSDDWFEVCGLDRLIPGRGVAALLPDAGRPRCSPTGRAACTPSTTATRSRARRSSRGLTGTHQGRPFVASPLLKQRFDLETGRCLDDDTVHVTTYEVKAA